MENNEVSLKSSWHRF